MRQRRARAVAYLESAEPGKSTEWYATRLLLFQWQKDDAGMQAMREQLLSQQNTDGGWGWLVGDKSDALGTGQALYALASAGLPADDAAIIRAQQFLLSTQLKDGSWEVRGTKTNKKDSLEETSCYWGTCWAAIGLLQTVR